jgi:hypothetical protein
VPLYHSGAIQSAPLPAREYVKIEERYITDPFVVALRNSKWDTVEYVAADRRYACVTPAFEN